MGFLKKLEPPDKWKLPVILILAVFTGIALFSFNISNATSYLGDKPETCVNCHIMAPQYATWYHSSHREYDSYLKTSDTTFRSKYNGSSMIDMLEESPRMAVLWAGYAFSKDYSQGRGHYYAVEDIRNILRTGAPGPEVPSPQPNTCWTCKSPDVPRLMNKTGVAEFYRGTWDTKGSEIINPIGCADCHMPFISEGGQKFTDHHLQSPLNNIAASCQVCHREETEKLITDVYTRQDKIIENRNILETILVRCHVEAKYAWDKGATEAQMKEILSYIRKAQWRWDFSAAGHGNSFHSPVELGRIIAGGIAFAQDARIKTARLLADLGENMEIPYPDISSKAKVQAYIGLDMKKLKEEKKVFLDNAVPQWKNAGKEREKS